MSAKRIGAIAVFVCLTICFSVIGQTATVVVSTATVVSTGPYGSGTSAVTVFSLEVGSSIKPLYFKAPAGREKDMQAVAMAALINSLPVKIYTIGPATGGTDAAHATAIVGMEIELQSQ
jgi:hypothetical protein